MTHVLCWDIDGTLLSTGRAGIRAWEEALEAAGAVEADLGGYRTAGLTDAEIAVALAEEFGGTTDPAVGEAVLRRYEELLPDRLHLRQGGVLTGVREILEDLRGRDDVLSLLLTGNTPAGAEAKLRHYGLDGYFELGAYSEVGRDRESIARRALEVVTERLDGAPQLERLYVIGDTPHDVRCGKAIGARTVAVATGAYSADELREHDPWLLLDTLPPPARFAELLELAA